MTDNLMYLSMLSCQAISGDAQAWVGDYCRGCHKENFCKENSDQRGQDEDSELKDPRVLGK